MWSRERNDRSASARERSVHVSMTSVNCRLDPGRDGRKLHGVE